MTSNLISAGRLAAECSKDKDFTVTADDVARIAKGLGIQPEMRIDWHPLWGIEAASTIAVAVLEKFLPPSPAGAVLIVAVDIQPE